MDTSSVVLTIFAFGVVFEAWSILTGRLQEEARKSRVSCLLVVVISLLVLVGMHEKLLGGAGMRFVFYGVVLIFNATLFSVLFFRAGKTDRQVSEA